jgi:hypothetical protein
MNGATMGNEKQRKTFLSYSRANKDFAIKLAKELKLEGFSVWFDQLDISPGARWDVEVEKALEECEIFMIILTPGSITSENVRDEIDYAIDNGKRFLPVLLENCNVPLRLRRFQYVDFTNKDFDDGVESAKELLRNLIAQTTILREEIPAEPQDQIAQEEADHLAAQEAEADRLAKQKAEDERLAQAKVETERKAKEEFDRIVVQKADADQFAKQQTEDKRLVQAKAETYFKVKQESDRLAMQKAETDRKTLGSLNVIVSPENKFEQKTKTDWLQIWWLRGLIAVVVGDVLGFVTIFSSGVFSYFDVSTFVLVIIALMVFSFPWGIFGFIFYPNKTSYILLVICSFIFFIVYLLFSSFYAFYLGVASGFVLSAIISRILHVTKVI